MKLILGVSADGYLAKGPADRMKWLGHMDKRVFRILTMVGSEPLGVSRRSAKMMPMTLDGRSTIELSAQYMSLRSFHKGWPNAWLLGGPTLAMKALKEDMLNEVHMCHSQVSIGSSVPEAIPDTVTEFMTSECSWELALQTTLGDCTVRTWKRYG